MISPEFIEFTTDREQTMKEHAKLDGIGRGSRHFLRAALVVSALILVSLSICGPSAFAGNWRHFGLDAQYSAFNPLEQTINVGNIGTLERKWGIGCDDGGFSVISRSPAINGGKLYTSGAGSRLTAYNARTGKLLWRFGKGNAGWAPQPVVSRDGVVFYLEGSMTTYYLYAVDGTTGQMIWTAPLGFYLGFNDTSLVTIDEKRNLVYLVEEPQCKLFAFDKNTGEVAWYMSPAKDGGIELMGDYVLLNAGRIYARTLIEHDWELVSIGSSTHAVEIKYDHPNSDAYIVSLYTLCGDKLIVGYGGRWNGVAGYNMSSPTVVWDTELSAITGQIACNKTKNIIYVPTDPYLYALDATTGQLIWKYTGFGPIYNPSVANGIVYFISDTNMYALNESTGQKVFSYPLGYEGYETTQVAVSNGMLFFSGNGGDCDLFALGLPSQDLPVVTFKVLDSSASETGPDVGKLRVRRTGVVTAPLGVSYSVSGSATNGVDYTKLSGKITIQAGSTAASIAIKPVDDALTEGTETVKLDLVEDPSYQIGSPGSAIMSILDDD